MTGIEVRGPKSYCWVGRSLRCALWCPSDSSQGFRLSALYNVYVAAARVPP